MNFSISEQALCAGCGGRTAYGDRIHNPIGGIMEIQGAKGKNIANMPVQSHWMQEEWTIHDTIRQFSNSFSVDRIQWQAIIVNVGENFVSDVLCGGRKPQWPATTAAVA